MQKTNSVRKLFKSPRAQVAIGFGLVSLSSLSFAEGGSFDSSEAMAWIAAGSALALLITGAMFGLVTLIGAGKKAQRAGT